MLGQPTSAALREVFAAAGDRRETDKIALLKAADLNAYANAFENLMMDADSGGLSSRASGIRHLVRILMPPAFLGYGAEQFRRRSLKVL